MSRNKNYICKSNVIYDFHNLILTNLISKYGLEIDEEGMVWDPVEGKEFNTIDEWVEYVDYQDSLNEDIDSPYMYGKISKQEREFDGGFN